MRARVTPSHYAPERSAFIMLAVLAVILLMWRPRGGKPRCW